MALKDNKVVAVECSNISSSSESKSKSPWKKLEVVEAEITPILGEEDWPSLSGVKRPQNAKVACFYSLAAVEVQKPEELDGKGDCFLKEEQRDQQVQEIKEGDSNGDCFQREEELEQYVDDGDSSREQEHVQEIEQVDGNGDSSQGQSQNNAPCYPVPAPYYQSTVPRFPSSSVDTYFYQPMPPSFHRLDNQFVNSRARIPFQPFSRPMQGTITSVHHRRPLRSFHPANNFDTRLAMPGRPSGNMYYGWHYQQPYPVNVGIEPVYYPPPPHGPIRPPFLPRLAPQVARHSVPVVPPQLPLRARIARQIEYYFSDENLITDYYLIDQMDGEGWVPITTIANFPRVRMLATNIEYILDALRTSQSVEVVGHKVRKRNNWSRYVKQHNR